MSQPSVFLSSASSPYPAEPKATIDRNFVDVWSQTPVGLLESIRRRWTRERRRRKVGRAYDMALEIARVIPPNSRVLDVGCGSGFIAHHLSALVGGPVVGIDLGERAEAAIDYRQFDGRRFPVATDSVDAVVFCYVLHHAQDLGAVLQELGRVLSKAGSAIIYEDIPENWWDALVCWTHDLQWRKRTGPCTFRREVEWRPVFIAAGFAIVNERALSRWRNLFHPVRRRFYVLRRAS